MIFFGGTFVMGMQQGTLRNIMLVIMYLLSLLIRIFVLIGLLLGY